jgi:hypothetical protein
LRQENLGTSKVGLAGIFNHHETLRRDFTHRIIGFLGEVVLVAPHVRMRKGDVGNWVEICRVGIGDDGISEFLFDVVLLEHTFARASNVHAVPDLLG